MQLGSSFKLLWINENQGLKLSKSRSAMIDKIITLWYDFLIKEDDLIQ